MRLFQELSGDQPRDQIGAWYEDTILQSPFYSAAAMGPWAMPM